MFRKQDVQAPTFKLHSFMLQSIEHVTAKSLKTPPPLAGVATQVMGAECPCPPAALPLAMRSLFTPPPRVWIRRAPSTRPMRPSTDMLPMLPMLLMLLPLLMVPMVETADIGGNCRLGMLQEGEDGTQLMAGSARLSTLHTPQYPADVVESTAGACDVPKKESDRTRPGWPSHSLVPIAKPADMGPTERQVTIEGWRGGQGGGRAARRSKTARDEREKDVLILACVRPAIWPRELPAMT